MLYDLLPPFSKQEMKAAGLLETLVVKYQITWRHIVGGHIKNVYVNVL
jgi:hypothetical protein